LGYTGKEITFEETIILFQAYPNLGAEKITPGKGVIFIPQIERYNFLLIFGIINTYNTQQKIKL